MAQSTRSSGRGGAGNMSSNNPQVAPKTAEDLRTPTIKTSTYTTGRGGSGNMATNDPSNPAAARAAQDVDAPAAHSRDPKGTYHWGRGGEGNMVTVSGGNGEAPAAAKRDGSGDRGSGGKKRTESLQGVLDRGKEILGLKKEEKKSGAGETAVED